MLVAGWRHGHLTHGTSSSYLNFDSIDNGRGNLRNLKSLDVYDDFIRGRLS